MCESRFVELIKCEILIDQPIHWFYMPSSLHLVNLILYTFCCIAILASILFVEYFIYNIVHVIFNYTMY